MSVKRSKEEGAHQQSVDGSGMICVGGQRRLSRAVKPRAKSLMCPGGGLGGWNR
jgi:hypothetical protein